MIVYANDNAISKQQNYIVICKKYFIDRKEKFLKSKAKRKFLVSNEVPKNDEGSNSKD